MTTVTQPTTTGYNPYATPAATTPPTTTTQPTGGYNPYENTPPGTASTGSNLPFSLDSMDFNSIGSMVAHAGGGGFAAYKFGSQMGDNIKSIFGKTFFNGIKGTVMTGFKGAGVSALVSAGISAAANGYGVATGKVDSSEAVSNVVKDTIGGAVGGLAGVTAGGLGYMLLGRFGTIGTIASVALGAIGGVAGGQLASKMTEGF